MNYQYLDSNNQPAGPATLEEIRAMAREGKIAADPMVRAVGQSDWKLLSIVGVASAPSRAALPVEGTLLGDFVGVILKHVGAWLSPALVESSLRWARMIGHFAVLAGGALVLIYTLVAAIRTNSFGIFLTGLAYVVALAVAQFTAKRFLGSAEGLIANTPSRVSSLAFLECVGLLAALAAVVALVFGVTTSVQLESAVPLIPAILTAVLWGYIGAIALHPEIASVESGHGTAAEEAIGIVAFFLKAFLKIVPLFFGLLAVIGALVVLIGIVAPNSRLAEALEFELATLPLVALRGTGFAGAGAILTASLLPMAAYFLFLVACLPLELWRAVLSLPGKLDALRR